MSFWLNAFVPRDIAGTTTALSSGDYRGLTIFNAPPCYLTDQRNFSNEMFARSRMHSMARVDFKGSQPELTQRHRCDDLIECDPGSGEVLWQRSQIISNMNFVLLVSEPTILIRMDCKYNFLLGPVAHGIGDIEYNGTIAIDPAKRMIDIDIMICLYPAFEAYAAINDGPSAILFRHAPPPGILALGPPRGANRRIRTRLDNRNGDANF
jgi:hypothetical protein